MARSEVVRGYGGVSADERRADRRRRLLAAGRELWGRGGLGEVTVRGVCAAAGLQPRYFYEHFAGRDQLVEAVADQVRDQLLGTLVESALGVGGDLRERLRAALTAFFGEIAADPSVHAIMRTDLAVIPGLEKRRTESLDMVAELILRHGAADTAVVPAAGTDPRRAARFAAGGVNHLLEGWLAQPEGTPEELAELCTRLCLRLVDGRHHDPASGGRTQPAAD